MAVMAIHDRKREPVIGISTIDCCTEYQKVPPAFNKFCYPGGGSPECGQQAGICRVRKTRGDDETVENAPEEGGGKHIRGNLFAHNTAVLDVPVEVLGCLPDETRAAGHPLITPIGERRATSCESPASWTTRTTSSLDLYTDGASSAIAASFGART